MGIERRWLTASEAASYLNLNKKSIYRSCHQRKLPHAKVAGIGLRIDKRALDALLERESIGPREYGQRLEGK
ncbi:MAG: helix-turn-helix domain-containing protein [Acidobacteriota bacterium]|nr:helix-turn-helix domain-containing protein [Acidobacteriota bacterium]